ncbi:MAG: proline dehydrogenase family protein [Bacteroidota bacterium]
MSNIVRSEAKTKLSFEDTSIAFQSKSDFQLKKSLYLFALMNKNWIVKIGTFWVKLFLWLHFPIKKIIKLTIFGQFCGGESLKECDKTIAELAKNNIGTILDYSVEGEDSEKSFDKTLSEILLSIEKATNNKNIPFSVFKVSGIGDVDLLENLQKGDKHTKEELDSFEKIKIRFNKITDFAASHKVRLFIDAEESWIQDIIDELANEAMAKHNKDEVLIYNTYQLYRKDVLSNLKAIAERAKDANFKVGAKLVRGAYMEKERDRSHEENYCEPIHINKEDVDADYNAAIDFCVENRELISICLGTHNEFSCNYLVEAMEANHIPQDDKRFYFAQLLGMSDNISFNLAKAGYNVAKYVPYGPVDAVMPYLFRRADENTSMAGQSSREYKLLQTEFSRRLQAK